jgi:ABC-type uncharacterized transport system substrate-binding protein
MIGIKNIVISLIDKKLFLPTYSSKYYCEVHYNTNCKYLLCKTVSFNAELNELTLVAQPDKVNSNKYELSIEIMSNELSELCINSIVFNIPVVLCPLFSC